MKMFSGISKTFAGRFFLIALLASVSFSLTACGTTSMNYQDIADDAFLLYKKAEKSYKQADYQAANQYYQEFVTNHPDDVLYKIALYYLARTHEELGDGEKARENYQMVLEKFAGDFWADAAEKRLKKMSE